MLPLSVYLPFNRESLEGRFILATRGSEPPRQEGYWLLLQDEALLVLADDHGSGWRLPYGALPDGFGRALDPRVYLGTYRAAPCYAAGVPGGIEVPAGFHRETLLPRETRLTDDMLSLGGLAHQAIHWEATSRHCPRCGAQAESIPGEWGKRCPACAYDHYPHLHPAVIVLVRDGDQVLLTRKSFWPPGRYGLIAGFVEAGESLEGAAHREVREEAGVEIGNLQYVGSQYWPFPSQLMVGFTAAYSHGRLQVNQSELEDARWFSVHCLPELPPRLSIARFIIDNYARP
jgi:NAD+ diphosphatase